MSAARRFTLRLHSDRLAPKSEARLPARQRVVYVRDGDVLLRSAGSAAGLSANSAWAGRDEIALASGADGAPLLRGELAGGDETGDPAGTGITSTLVLSHAVEL